MVDHNSKAKNQKKKEEKQPFEDDNSDDLLWKGRQERLESIDLLRD